MFYKLRTKIAKERFSQLTSGIFETPPVPLVDAPWSIISMVGDADVQLYLLALKSLYRQLRRGKVTAIIAKTMPVESRALMERHFPGIRFAKLEDIDTGPCQHGGMWERILFLLDHSKDEYAIQMDCDTLTVGDIGEVANCIANNLPVTLSSRGEPIWGLAETARNARSVDSNYIGIAVERLLDKYPNAQQYRYVRASAAFTGFAKGGFTRAGAEAFHTNMKQHVGERWKEWGTEQNASNFAIANSAGAVVLPYPKYANFTPDLTGDATSFFHFFGTYRYHKNVFAQRALDVIKALRAEH